MNPDDSKLTDADKLAKIKEYKEKGNTYHKEGDFKKAMGSYHRAILYCKGLSCNCPQISDMMGMPGMEAQASASTSTMSPECFEESRKLTCDCYNNLAACMLKEPEPKYERIMEHCDMALSASPSNEKALFRKGLCLYHLGQYSEALEVLRRAPSGPEVRKYIDLSQEGEKQQDKELATMYKNMFKS